MLQWVSLAIVIRAVWGLQSHCKGNSPGCWEGLVSCWFLVGYFTRKEKEKEREKENIWE
jgi:hypothetical protein